MKRLMMWTLVGVGSVEGQGFGLTGEVRSGGTALAGARVTVTRLPETGDDRLRVVRSVIAGPGGEYALEGLAGGRYRVCAELPGSQYLDPCEWDAKAPQARVEGRGVNRQNVQMERGAMLVIQVEDVDGMASGAGFEAGVRTGRGELVRAREKYGRGKEKWYLVAVPKGRSATVVARSAGARVEKVEGNGRTEVGGGIAVGVGAAEEVKEVRMAVRRK